MTTRDRALCAYVNLMRAAESLSARLSKSSPAAGEGLTETQFGVLEALYHLGPMCQRDVGRKVLKSCGNVTFVLDNLARAGLVRRRPSAEDRRFVSVHLTEKGRRLVDRLFPGHAAAIVKEMAPLSAAEQEDLRRICRKLGKGGGTCAARST